MLDLCCGRCWLAEPWINRVVSELAPDIQSHVDKYMLFAFTLGCDCLRTSGVHVTLNHVIDQGERLSGSVDWLVQAKKKNKHPSVYIHICVSDCWSKQGSWSGNMMQNTVNEMEAIAKSEKKKCVKSLHFLDNENSNTCETFLIM